MLAELKKLGIDKKEDLKTFSIFNSGGYKIESARKLDDEFYLEGLDDRKEIVEPKEEPVVKEEAVRPEDGENKIVEPEKEKVSPAIVHSGFKKVMDHVDIYEVGVEKPNERNKKKSKEEKKDVNVVQQVIENQRGNGK